MLILNQFQYQCSITATGNTDTYVDANGGGVGTHRMYRQGVGCIRGTCRKEMKSILFRETKI